MQPVQLITSERLKSWLDSGKPVSVIDIRKWQEVQRPAIQGSIHIDVYDRIKEHDNTAFDNLHLDKSVPVVTYCTGGKLSIEATEILLLKGYNAFSLEGGLNSWNH